MTQTIPSLRRIQAHYTMIQILYWASTAAFCGFLTSLLFGRSFTSSDVGIFTAIRCLSGIFSQPLLGGWVDRHPKVPLKLLLGGCLILALGVHIAFIFVHFGFWGTAIVMLLLGVLEVNAYPMLDSLAVQFINAGINVNFSLSRGIGSFSFAIFSIVIGRQVTALGTESMLWTHLVFLVLVIAAILSFPVAPRLEIPRQQVQQTQQEQPHSVLEILRLNPAFTWMLIAMFLGMTAASPLGNFMVNFTTSRGGTETHVGIAFFLTAAFEFPAAFLFPYLWRKFGSGGSMLWVAVFMALKPLAYLLSPNLLVFLLVQPIQLLGYGVFIPGCVYYTNECVSPADRIRGQSLMMAASNGLGGMIGNLLAGYLIDFGGVNFMLAISTAISFVAIIPAVISVRCQKKVS